MGATGRISETGSLLQRISARGKAALDPLESKSKPVERWGSPESRQEMGEATGSKADHRALRLIENGELEGMHG
jgi:hypothetical protein